MPMMVSGSGITRFLGGGQGPCRIKIPARIEGYWLYVWTSMRTYRAETGSANFTFSTTSRTELPTNSLPSSTYVKSVLDAFDTRTLNVRIIWSLFLRDCTATPAMVCTAPESMVIHSPGFLPPADHA